MNDHQSLRDYQEYLRNRMEEARKGDGVEKAVFLGFVSGGRHFLVDGRDVDDVHDATTTVPIPLAKPWAVGAANVKGTVYAVTDFSVLMGGGATRKGKFMVLAPGVMPGAAILIDRISGLFDPSEIEKMSPTTNPDMPGWIVGEYYLGQEYLMTDFLKLAADVRFSKLQSGETQ